MNAFKSVVYGFVAFVVVLIVASYVHQDLMKYIDGKVSKVVERQDDIIDQIEFFGDDLAPVGFFLNTNRRPLCTEYCRKIVAWVEECKGMRVSIDECLQPMPAEMICLEAMMRFDNKTAGGHRCDITPYFAWNDAGARSWR